MSISWPDQQKALQNWVVACTGVSSVIWAQQKGPRPAQDGIVLRIMNIEDHGMPWLDTAENNLSFAPFNVTAVPATNTLNKTAHGLLTGDGPIRLETTGTVPGNLETLIDYWVIKVDANSFKLAATYLDAMNGTGIVLGSAGTGTLSVTQTVDTLRQGQELALKARSLMKCWLSIECYTSSGVGLDMAQAILWRLNAKRLLPTPAAILKAANIGVIEVGRVRAISGIQDVVLFEPRANVDVLLHLVSEETDFTTFIERVELTEETRNASTTVDAANFTPTAFDAGLD